MAGFALISSFVLLAVVPSVATAALLPRASGSPSCVAQCPASDAAGFPLGETSDTNGILFCSYPAFAGESSDDFYCDYNDTTGALVTDNDAGFCPGSAALSSCAPARRDSNFKAVKRRAAARAAQPRTSNPEAMAIRSALYKKKRENSAR
ncbi:hypothetical protein FIBSPDRAFT_861260 [Athelia psychrophila]|uniref:Uncharacterized protein n=1 Tax=Athelia psychrophila TaxID=1759441 RepID=A0A166JFX8_9AGAM|nr:hypothetical protein FIBSPDRAFT_861260 [Fibularhizoctonia sp. CBS 109695]